MADVTPILNPGDWPLVNNYTCTCNTCKETYFGPKHSVICWNHLTEEFQKMWFDTAK